MMVERQENIASVFNDDALIHFHASSLKITVCFVKESEA